MAEDRERSQDVSEAERQMREQEREAREHAPEERRPEERGEANTASEAADIQR